MTKFNINTNVYVSGLIEQIISKDDAFLDDITVILREIFNTKEQQIREALIKLGWTPPEGE